MINNSIKLKGKRWSRTEPFDEIGPVPTKPQAPALYQSHADNTYVHILPIYTNFQQLNLPTVPIVADFSRSLKVLNPEPTER